MIVESIDVAELLKLGSGLFALFLLLISILAYYRSRQRRLIFVSCAFGLYFLKVIVEHIDLFIPNIETSFLDLLLALIDFIILLLFFLAIVVRNSYSYWKVSTNLIVIKDVFIVNHHTSDRYLLHCNISESIFNCNSCRNQNQKVVVHS